MAKFIKPIIKKAKNCPMCASGEEADYKDTTLLKKFISERGKIMGRARTGLCARHQRQITRNVKRARVMALLPFVTG